MNLENLISTVIQCIYNVRGILGPGYLESVYKKALMREFELNDLYAAAEVPLCVSYKDVLVGEFRADIIVENRVIIELKAVEALNKAHEVQLVNYLTITGIDSGILVNFGASTIQIKRKYRVYTPK